MSIRKNFDGQDLIDGLPEVKSQDVLIYIQILLKNVDDLKKRIEKLENKNGTK